MLHCFFIFYNSASGTCPGTDPSGCPGRLRARRGDERGGTGCNLNRGFLGWFLLPTGRDQELTQEMGPSSKVTSEIGTATPSSSGFNPSALIGVSGFSGGGTVFLAPTGLGVKCLETSSPAGFLGRRRGAWFSKIPTDVFYHCGPGASPSGRRSKDPASPKGQCRIKETHLKKAYAAEAQVTCLTNAAGLLTAYLDAILQSVSLPEPVASELHLVSGTLLQISDFQGQAFG
ncbi:UNVERIFIED_CONTAM: hypothetical protein FKN15_075303 [Acipenser sinensis]